MRKVVLIGKVPALVVVSRRLVAPGHRKPLTRPLVRSSTPVSVRGTMKRPESEKKDDERCGVRRHMLQNLKSLYNGYKLITCLTSSATPDILPSQNRPYSVFSAIPPRFPFLAYMFFFRARGQINLFLFFASVGKLARICGSA